MWRLAQIPRWRSKIGYVVLAAAVTCALAPALVVGGAASAAGRAAPGSVTIAGSLQSELGCTGDWDPTCAVTAMTYDSNDDVWQADFVLDAGTYDYKAALNQSWDVNYGAGGVFNGSNITLTVPSTQHVQFFYDDKTHWVTDSVTSFVVTAPGDFQSELGCSADWSPDCLRSWLEDPDGDGVYTFRTIALGAGTYSFKVTLNQTWDVNYGDGGVLNGANIAFSVPAFPRVVTIRWNSMTNVPSVTVVKDTVAPTAQPKVNPKPNSHGWNNRATKVTWHWSDPEPGTGLVTTSCRSRTKVGSEGVHAVKAACTDNAGNAGHASRTVRIDQTLPVLHPSGLDDGAVVARGTPALAVDPGATDALSGVLTQSCSKVMVGSVGTRSVSCAAADKAGNRLRQFAAEYYVTDAFLGFAPDLPTSASAGSTVVARFSVGNFSGVASLTSQAIKLVAAPKGSALGVVSTQVTCSPGAGVGVYRCPLVVPAALGKYVLRAFEKIPSGGYQLISNAATVARPNARALSVTT